MKATPTHALPTVLVVDDEVRSQESLRRTLEEDFEVRTASDAAEAIAILEEGPIEVVLTDQRMPGRSGVGLLKEVRERWPDTVRIIISGYTHSEDIIAGVNEAGIYQYLLKPWHPAQLLLTLKRAAELHRLQGENCRLAVELRAGEPVLRARVEQARARVKALRARDGAAVAVSFNCMPRHNHRGALMGLVVTGRPLGELRRAYRELHEAHEDLKRTQQQSLHSEKMASLGRLVVGVAHELNNPIGFVPGNVHALERYAERLARCLVAVHGGGRRGRAAGRAPRRRQCRGGRGVLHPDAPATRQAQGH